MNRSKLLYNSAERPCFSRDHSVCTSAAVRDKGTGKLLCSWADGAGRFPATAGVPAQSAKAKKSAVPGRILTVARTKSGRDSSHLRYRKCVSSHGVPVPKG